MSNAGHVNRIKAKTPANSEATQAKWQGYQDAAQGLPFALVYDTWPEWMQRNYEWGRSLAVRMRAEHSTVPRWARNRLIVGVLPADVLRAEQAHHTSHIARRSSCV